MKIDHAGVSASELRLQPLLPQNCERNRGIENSSYTQCHYVGARKPNLLERLVRPPLDRKCKDTSLKNRNLKALEHHY